MMRLTWRDAATAPFAAMVAAVYAAHLAGAGGWLLADVHGTALTVLVLGFGGGCVLGAAESALTPGPARWNRLALAGACVLGLTASISGVLALATADAAALALLVAATMALWALSTVRHATTARRPSAADEQIRAILSTLRPRWRH